MARFHSIVAVTQGGILYKDIAEITRWIDFKTCNRNWYDQIQQVPSPLTHELDQHCVARYSFWSAQLSYIEFFTDSIIRLEFDEADTLVDLLEQMKVYGNWFAYNLD